MRGRLQHVPAPPRGLHIQVCPGDVAVQRFAHADVAGVKTSSLLQVSCVYAVAIGNPNFGNVAPLIVGLSLVVDIFACRPFNAACISVPAFVPRHHHSLSCQKVFFVCSRRLQWWRRQPRSCVGSCHRLPLPLELCLGNVRARFSALWRFSLAVSCSSVQLMRHRCTLVLSAVACSQRCESASCKILS